MATPVLEPLDPGQVASMLADAGRQGITVVPRGSGTKLTWTRRPNNAGAYLSTRQIASPVQHFAGDLVATIPTGATLANANAVLAQAGQWLPLDPSHTECATIGGIVATNDSGPRRHKHGSPRDLIIGVEIALSDGRLAKAGGRVVKNVAGYDLSRLVCGSFGTLAVITSATFKLAPLPAASRTIVATCSSISTAASLALAVASQPVTPSALEIQAPSARLLIRFETTERAADQMAATTRALLHEGGAKTDVLDGESESEAWNQHQSAVWAPASKLVAKISLLPADVDGCLQLIAGSQSGANWCAVGRAALGLLLVRFDGPGTEDTFVRLRQYVENRKGTVVVLHGAHGPDAVAGPEADANLRSVMDAVKARFDPADVLPAWS
jgi:glycolate oxidase FAD binding subunit